MKAIITLSLILAVVLGLLYVHRKPIVRIMRAWSAMEGNAGASEFSNPTPQD